MTNIHKKDMIRNNHNRKIQKPLKIQKGKFTPIDYHYVETRVSRRKCIDKNMNNQNTLFVYVSHKEMTSNCFIVSNPRKEKLMYDAKHKKKF